ncbi:hypothetical protein LSTR_LSTR015932 [Laodelphax striatellus]|uniref:Uncharacterized protein n=1 Tax=Laodelphax striatellus TaxID=195883 RepID=A0A482WV14_LAOST|nr:hypothetical protein LSTR_LSTR015932 [Laodelphax striatellus]
MKLDKTEDCTEIATKSEDVEESTAMVKKRKKAEKRHHNHHSDHNHHHHKHHKHHKHDDEKPAVDTSSVVNSNSAMNYSTANSDSVSVVNNTMVDSAPVSNGGQVTSRNNHEGKHQKKKKNATVKALLEEKRLQHTDPNIRLITGTGIPLNNRYFVKLCSVHITGILVESFYMMYKKYFVSVWGTIL